jgi:hypothetical protein
MIYQILAEGSTNIIVLLDIYIYIYIYIYTTSVLCILKQKAYAVAQSVEALRYKPEGQGFDSLQCHWNFSLR